MFNTSSKFQGLKFRRKGKIWQLFRATDFESLMCPCFTFCRLLGIFPYKINATTIETCKPSYILSIIITCISCTLTLITLYNLNIVKDIIVNNTPGMIERNFFHILGVFILITTSILSGPRMRFLQTILKLSLKLPPKSYQNLSRLIHAKDILGFLFLIILASIFSYLTPNNFLRKLLMLYILLVVFQMDMLYMNCVCILRACFKQINDNLRKLMTNDEPYFLNNTYDKQRNPFLLIEITALKKQHLAINDTVQMLKIVFSLQILSSIIMTFIEITFMLYFYLVRIQGGLSVSNQEKPIYYMLFVTIVIHYFTKIMLIIWACETGKNQAIEISNTIHDVFNRTSNKEIKYEMQLFSLQLLHCENVFSVKGVTVDATLLTAIVGGITTYMLLLIQFLFMTNSCNGVHFTDL